MYARETRCHSAFQYSCGGRKITAKHGTSMLSSPCTLAKPFNSSYTLFWRCSRGVSSFQQRFFVLYIYYISDSSLWRRLHSMHIFSSFKQVFCDEVPVHSDFFCASPGLSCRNLCQPGILQQHLQQCSWSFPDTSFLCQQVLSHSHWRRYFNPHCFSYCRPMDIQRRISLQRLKD